MVKSEALLRIADAVYKIPECMRAFHDLDVGRNKTDSKKRKSSATSSASRAAGIIRHRRRRRRSNVLIAALRTPNLRARAARPRAIIVRRRRLFHPGRAGESPFVPSVRRYRRVITVRASCKSSPDKTVCTREGATERADERASGREKTD